MGQSMLNIPYSKRKMIIETIEIASILKGSPPSTVECYAVSTAHMKNNSSLLFFEAMI